MVRAYQAQTEWSALDERARRMQHLVNEMPVPLRRLVEETWASADARDVLPLRAAALKLGINTLSYRIARAEALGWLVARWEMPTQSRRTD